LADHLFPRRELFRRLRGLPGIPPPHGDL
jgi:hypothetical protein